MHSELEIQSPDAAFGCQPGSDACRARAGIQSGRRSESRRHRKLLILRAPPAITTAARLASLLLRMMLMLRFARMLWFAWMMMRLARMVVMLLRVVMLLLLRRFPARKLGSSAVAHRDEQRRHVFAVLARFLECRARTVRRDSFAAQTNGHLVRIRIRTFDPTTSTLIVDTDVFDDSTLLVVQSA
jgi:hypothetical protein